VTAWNHAARVVFCASVLVGILFSLFLVPPNPHGGGTQVLHVLGYAGLTVLGLLGWPRRPRETILAIILLGMVLECLQGFHPARAFEWQDMGANLVGIASATAAFWIARLKSRIE